MRISDTIELVLSNGLRARESWRRDLRARRPLDSTNRRWALISLKQGTTGLSAARSQLYDTRSLSRYRTDISSSADDLHHIWSCE